MDMSNYRLQKQNTAYELQYNRKISSPYAISSTFKRLSRPHSKSNSRETTGSRASAARGDITYEVAYSHGSDQGFYGLKRSLSAGNISARPLEVFQQRHSSIPVKVDAREMRKSPENMQQLKNIVRTMIKTHVDNLKEEMARLNDQNRNLKEELHLHSETICKLLDLTTEKNQLIADIKTQNSKLESEIEKKFRMANNNEVMKNEIGALRKRLLASESKLRKLQGKIKSTHSRSSLNSLDSISCSSSNSYTSIPSASTRIRSTSSKPKTSLAEPKKNNENIKEMKTAETNCSSIDFRKSTDSVKNEKRKEKSVFKFLCCKT